MFENIVVYKNKSTFNIITSYDVRYPYYKNNDKIKR